MQVRRARLSAILIVAAVSAILFVAVAFSRGTAPGPKLAANVSPQAQSSTDSTSVPIDDGLQRAPRINTYRIAADSGPIRGETIYYYKCWVCHNKYTKSAPYLKDLFKRSTLVTGAPVSDESVAEQIKNGSEGMPSFRTTLSDKDIADLESYIKNDSCCHEGEDAPVNPWYKASSNPWSVPTSTSGGPTGMVRIADGELPEGIRVQLIAPNGVRTTVFTDVDGKYEFPKMQPGSYILRIPTPLEFKAYRRDNVQVADGTKFDEIVLEPISKTEFLPPTPAVEAQMSGAEILWNLAGTGQQKDSLRRACGDGCHSFQQILRNHYDERSWRLLLDRMTRHSGSTLINYDANSIKGRGGEEVVNNLVKWLATVRGPDAQDAPLRVFPRPNGESTRVVITEYELPRVMISPHDVYGDGKGNIWYTSHRTQFMGKLDSRTGVVTEYTVPLTPGSFPGTHHVVVDKKGIVWVSENWAHNLTRLDPHTGEFKQMHIEYETPIPTNSPGFSNFAIAPDGFVWSNHNGEVQKIDPSDGKIVSRYLLPKNKSSYDNTISDDGKYWAGGAPPGSSGNSANLLNIKTGEMLELNTGYHLSEGRRGGFDPFDNAWFGGGDGAFVELDIKRDIIREYWPNTPFAPYTDFYEAMPDKNGEIWGGMLHGRGFVRFNPKTGRWIDYEMPEPYGHDRRTWIDNSTNPVTVWYTDYSLGEIIRIQPLD